MMSIDRREDLIQMFRKLEEHARDRDEKVRYTEARLFHEAKLIEERAERARNDER